MPYLARRFRPVLSLTAAVCLASGGALAVAAQPSGPAVAHGHPQRYGHQLSEAVRDLMQARRAG
jgi:hypothetical protein